MRTPSKISCVIENTDISCPLGLEIWLNDQMLLDCPHVADSINFQHELADSADSCELKFVMKGKLPAHTQIDQQENIVADARLRIQQLCFDEFELGHLITDLATYTHDFNGTGNIIQDKFFGEIGCNGTVSLKFTTPVYLWLLENM